MVIYLAHPYTKRPEKNKVKAERLIKDLTINMPEHTFISPIHNFSILAGVATEGQIMDHCKKLIDKSDKVIFAPGWMDSAGCREEMEYCINTGKRYAILMKDYSQSQK